MACDAVVADIHCSVLDADDEQDEELYSSRTGSTGKERIEAGDTSGSEYFPSPKKQKEMGTCPVDLGNSIFSVRLRSWLLLSTRSMPHLFAEHVALAAAAERSLFLLVFVDVVAWSRSC